MAGAFVWSDAWLLLAVIYAGRPADRETLRRFGDGINHALLSDEELEGGLQRLQAAEYVAESDQGFQPTPVVLDWYQRNSPPRARIHKDLERVEGFLGVRRRG